MRREISIVTQAEIDAVWGNADFGPQRTRLDVVKYGLLKCAGSWYQGHTSTCILRELKLITNNNYLTLRGKRNLYEFFKDDKKNV